MDDPRVSSAAARILSDGANTPVLAFDSSGAVYAAFTERTDVQYLTGWYVYALYVSKLVGSWIALGGALNDNTGLSAGGIPALVGLTGGPVLLWDEGNEPNVKDIYQRNFSLGTSTWSAPSSAPGVYTDNWSLTAAAGGNGALHVGGWVGGHVKVFSRAAGSQSWLQLGGDLDRTGSSGGRRPVIAADASGNVAVAWLEWIRDPSGNYGYHLRVKRLNR